MIDVCACDSDEVFYDKENTSFTDRDSILDELDDSVWEDFDVDDFVYDNYSIGDLWDAINNNDAESFKEEVIDQARDAAHDEAYDIYSDSVRTEFDAEFEIDGNTYKGCECVTISFLL